MEMVEVRFSEDDGVLGAAPPGLHEVDGVPAA